MSQTNRRAPAKGSRRFPLTVTVTEEINQGLLLIGNNNRSAAIEMLVQQYLAKRPHLRAAEPVTNP